MTQDMTPEAVAKMLEGVTPGPWRLDGDFGVDSDAMHGYVANTGFGPDTEDSVAEASANARFIAWAREAVPAIAAERDEWKARAEAAEAEVARLRAGLTRIADFIDQQVGVTRSYAKDSDMGRNNVTLMEICTSHFLDAARDLRALQPKETDHE